MARHVRLAPAAASAADEAMAAGRAPELYFDNPHPLVVAFYESLEKSAQSRLYEPSDWWTAQIICWHLDRQIKDAMLENRRPNAQMLTAILSQFDDLMVTEGARRRLQFATEAPDLRQDARLAEVRQMFKDQAAS